MIDGVILSFSPSPGSVSGAQKTFCLGPPKTWGRPWPPRRPDHIQEILKLKTWLFLSFTWGVRLLDMRQLMKCRSNVILMSPITPDLWTSTKNPIRAFEDSVREPVVLNTREWTVARHHLYSRISKTSHIKDVWITKRSRHGRNCSFTELMSCWIKIPSGTV